jgi:hypothetical protein
MSYEATVEFKFNSTYTPTYKSGFGSTIDDDFIPEEHFVITAPAADLSCRQYFKLFEKFMLCVGMSPCSIRSGAMSLVFNDCVNEADQRKVCKEYELTMDEDLRSKFEEWKKAEEEWARLEKKTDTVADNVEAMYWKNKYIAELEAQGKLDNDHQPQSHQDDEFDSANGVA